MDNICKTCRWADIIREKRTIERKGCRFNLSPGTIFCKCTDTKHITMNDRDMTCSSYEEVSKIEN